MARYNDKSRMLTRRAFVFGGLQTLGFGALAARLGYLQFFKNEEYRTLAINNAIKLQPLLPDRGKLLDRTGVVLAHNEKNYQAMLDVSALNRREAAEMIRRTSIALGLSESDLETVLKTWRARPYMPVMVKEHLSWEELSAVEMRRAELPGMSIAVGQTRAYPFVDHLAHTIGYVSAVDEKEQEKHPDQPILKLPDYRIGKSGIEHKLEDVLRGTPGYRQVEVDVHGQVVRELSVKPMVAGETITLTLDNRLQEYGTRLLQGESAAACVLNVETGDVLALISVPGFDPNVFSTGIPQAYWDQLRADKYDPLVNKAIQGQYPPGSTFKMLVGMAGMESDAINPNTHVNCPGHFFLGNHRFNCWKEGGHGSMNLVSAIQQSCDTFFYTVAQRTGIDPIAAMAKKFGLGDDALLGLLGEKPGIVPDDEWKQKRFKQRWTTGDTVNVGIGQGYVLATPLQLAVMAARLATGRAVQPRLVAGDAPPPFEPLDVSEQTLGLVHQGMNAVVNQGGGTAYGKRIAEEKYAMAGKTGTSQVRRIAQRGMKQELLPWEHRHHALFVGYAPVNAPKYAVSVLVEHGGGGSASAAPRARDMLWKIQLLDDGVTDDPPTEPAKPLT